MTEMRSALASVLILALPLVLGGCPAAVVGGLAAAGGAGYEAAQERGVQGQVDDFNLKTNIQRSWQNADANFPAMFDVTVYDGRVLLTGNAANMQAKRQAFDLASRVPGVREIFNEIEVNPPGSNWEPAQDAWITAQLRSKLVFDGDIRSPNYTIETTNGTVYLMGSARSQGELDRATNHARYVPGVRRVVSFVQLRSGVPVAQQRYAPPPASYGAPPPSSYSAPPPSYGGGPGYSPGYQPSAPPSGRPSQIEVQRL